MAVLRSWLSCLLTFMLVLAGGCASDERAGEITESTWDVVILSDSMLRYVGPLYAEHVASANDVDVVLHNEAQDNRSALGLLALLEDDDNAFGQPERELVREAEVVVYLANPGGLTAGGRDLNCGLRDSNYTRASCDGDDFQPYEAALEQIASHIKRLRDGQPTIIRAVEYFSPAISRWQDAGVYEECLACDGYHRQAMRNAAAAHGIPVAKVWDEFNGPEGTEDPVEKGYISGDGKHPSNEGDRAIADLLHDLGYEPTP
jgi:hypothetical protein